MAAVLQLTAYETILLSYPPHSIHLFSSIENEPIRPSSWQVQIRTSETNELESSSI